MRLRSTETISQSFPTINESSRLDNVVLDFTENVVDLLLGAHEYLQRRRINSRVMQSTLYRVRECVCGVHSGGGRVHVVVVGRCVVVSGYHRQSAVQVGGHNQIISHRGVESESGKLPGEWTNGWKGEGRVWEEIVGPRDATERNSFRKTTLRRVPAIYC